MSPKIAVTNRMLERAVLEHVEMERNKKTVASIASIICRSS
jgi:hypothetical protein